MFQTLFGNRTSLQQLQTNNFLCNFHSKLTNSNPSISQASPSSMQRLGNMLTIRNKKYKNKQVSNINDFNVQSLNLKEKSYSKLKLDNKSLFSEDDHYVGFQDAEAIMDDVAEKFLKFGLGGKIEVWVEERQEDKQLVVIRILGQALKNMHLGYINGTYALEQSKSEILLKYLHKKQPQINELQLQDPLWIQLTNQLNCLKQNSTYPILSLFSNNNSHSINNQFLPGLTQGSKYKKFKLFLSEQPGKRVLLNRYLYELNDQSMFHIVTQYDSFFHPQKNWSVSDIHLFCRKLTMWVAEGNGNQVVGWLMGFMQDQFDGASGFRGWEQIRAWGYGVDFFHKIMEVKVWRWATVKINNTQQIAVYHDLIKQKYIRQLPEILQAVPDTPQNKALQLKLLNYNCLKALSRNKHLLALLLLELEQPTTTKLIRLTSEWNKKQAQIYEKVKQILHQHPMPACPNKQKQNKNHNNHSMSNLSKNSKIIYDFVTDCFPLLSIHQCVDLLLSNRTLLETIDWQYVLSLMTQPQQVQIVSLVIPSSIRIYKNTTAFLNTGIPFQSIMPYYQIQILIQGLTSILTQDARLTQKDKSKFFGMMQIYRGQILPAKQQFPMTILQMLFEWYMLKQAMIEEDYKSLGLSLRCNLEQVQSVYITSTDGLTHSSRSHVTQRMHNPQYLKKIGKCEFMRQLNEQTQYHNSYISYLYVICESICEIKQSRQKIIRSNKIQIWVDLLLMKIRSSLEDAKGELSRKLAKLRDACLRVFAVHGF